MPPLALDPRQNNSSSIPNNVTDAPLQVICAWPISGTYGPGSRYLYYMVAIAAILARKQKWLLPPTLAAALLLPSVAAIHGIVLAALHVDRKVDMDIYGAFQLCSIAILAAPVTVNLSQTYFNNPARNIIYLWTGLILAGLLSLTIEFYRANPEPCIEDGNLVTLKSNSFKYGTTMCSLTAICASDALPFSPMRRDAADDIFVIPAPTVLSFGTGTLMAAGCCIPAILSLLMMWDRIQRINWVRRWGRHNEPNLDERIRGTRATVGLIRQVEGKSRRVLMIVYVVFFGGAVLAIILLGELNFWSEPVRFQSEPFASIGQWGNIAGILLASLGSAYALYASGPEEAPAKEKPDCTHCQRRNSTVPTSPVRIIVSEPLAPSEKGDPDREPDVTGHDVPVNGETEKPTSPQSPSTPEPPQRTRTAGSNMSSQPVDDDPKVGRHRRRINSLVDRLGEWMATAQETYDDSNFREGMAGDFPLIPGEQYRVPVDHYQEKWSKIRDRSRSRPPSVNSMDEAASPTSPSSPRWGGGSSRLGVPGRQMTLPTSKPIPWGEAGPSSSSGGRVSGENPPTSGPRGRQLHRRDTLEAPPSASRAGRRMVREQFASSSSASSLSPQQLSPRGPNMAAGFRGSQSTQTAPYSPGLAVPVEGEALSLTLPPLGPVSPACPAAAAVGPGPGSSAIVDSPPVTPTAGPSSSSAGPSEAQPAS